MPASRRPYRSHKTPACDRCRRFKRRCTGGGPDDPCVLCKLHEVPCLPSEIATASPRRRAASRSQTLPGQQQSPSRRDPKVGADRGSAACHVGSRTAASKPPSEPRSGLGPRPEPASCSSTHSIDDLDKGAHGAMDVGDTRTDSSIVVSPMLTEDLQTLERYFSSGAAAAGDETCISERPLVYIKVPRRRDGLAVAKHPGKLQGEMAWQIMRPFAGELIRLYVHCRQFFWPPPLLVRFSISRNALSRSNQDNS